LFQETSRMLSSSTAARRNAAERGLAGRNAATDLGANLMTGSVKSSLFQMAAQAIRGGGISDAVAERVAEKLASKVPNNVGAGVQFLKDFADKSAQDAKNFNRKEASSVFAATNKEESSPPDPVIQRKIDENAKNRSLEVRDALAKLKKIQGEEERVRKAKEDRRAATVKK